MAARCSGGETGEQPVGVAGERAHDAADGDQRRRGDVWRSASRASTARRGQLEQGLFLPRRPRVGDQRIPQRLGLKRAQARRAGPTTFLGSVRCRRRRGRGTGETVGRPGRGEAGEEIAAPATAPRSPLPERGQTSSRAASNGIAQVQVLRLSETPKAIASRAARRARPARGRLGPDKLGATLRTGENLGQRGGPRSWPPPRPQCDGFHTRWVRDDLGAERQDAGPTQRRLPRRNRRDEHQRLVRSCRGRPRLRLPPKNRTDARPRTGEGRGRDFHTGRRLAL